MLTEKQNERLTRVGPGTPMGRLFRRYWHPVAPSAMLHDEPVKAVRLLGEDYVIFRDKQGKLGCVEPRCAHRQLELKYGFVVDEGLRCPYHGWSYDTGGRCTLQPAEPADSSFKDKIRLKSFPIQEREGLIFLYVGPEPVPKLAWWDRVADRIGYKHVTIQELPCNWLQMAENITDYSHSAWLHGHYATYILDKLGIPDDDPRWRQVRSRAGRLQKKLDWRLTKHGISSHVLLDGQTEDHEMWQHGHQLVMPNVNALAQSGLSFTNYYVPVDDTHTLLVRREHYYFSHLQVEPQEEDKIPYFAPPWMMYDENGERRMDHNNGQDNMAFTGQGVIFDRTKENLGTTDAGVIMYRKLLEDQMQVVESGGEPMNVFQTDADLQTIEKLPPLAYYYDRGRDGDGGYSYGATTGHQLTQYSPYRDTIEALFMEESRLATEAAGKREAEKQPAAPR